MRFSHSKLSGLWFVDPERLQDERGYFTRTFCVKQFEEHGLETQFIQSSTAFTVEAGTLRGLHFQGHPHWETKLVRCTRGSAFVVAVDLRRDSSTHLHWIGTELTCENGRALYVPEGFAQGYQTLENGTELLYQMTKDYHPDSATGCSFDDPAFGIEWPLPPKNLSVRDREWEHYSA